jgi:hypothetical protein
MLGTALGMDMVPALVVTLKLKDVRALHEVICESCEELEERNVRT